MSGGPNDELETGELTRHVLQKHGNVRNVTSQLKAPNIREHGTRVQVACKAK